MGLMILWIYLLFPGGAAISQVMAPSAAPGTTFTVEVTIKKADVQSFAKFQEIMPTGFTAEAIDAKGATIIKRDSVIKFIWVAIPTDPYFTISFRVKVSSDVLPGMKIMRGVFKYVNGTAAQEATASNNIMIEGTPSFGSPVTATNQRDTVYVPDIFNAGGTGHSILEPLGNNIAAVKLAIFDRWGAKLFESSSEGWDGSFEGKPVAAGSYAYVLTGTFRDGRPFSHVGKVQVVR